MNEPLVELEQLRRRVAVLEKLFDIHVKCSCPHIHNLPEMQCPPLRATEEQCRQCWTAALTQAEGETP